MKSPAAAEFWTPDEVAECLNVSNQTYAELWNLVNQQNCKRGKSDCRHLDGLDEEGHFHPDIILQGRIDNSLKGVFHLLSPSAQADVIAAFERTEKEFQL